VLELAHSPLLRRHLARGGLRSARAHTWEHTLALLAGGYHRALACPRAAGHDPRRLSTTASDRAA
jgi:hypothetical protein